MKRSTLEFILNIIFNVFYSFNLLIFYRKTMADPLKTSIVKIPP